MTLLCYLPLYIDNTCTCFRTQFGYMSFIYDVNVRGNMFQLLQNTVLVIEMSNISGESSVYPTVNE